MVQRVSPEGALAPGCRDDPGMTDQELLYAFRVMIQSRAIDEWAVSLTRQGRLLPYPPAVGQEANSVGGAMALRADDWIVYAYRDSTSGRSCANDDPYPIANIEEDDGTVKCYE